MYNLKLQTGSAHGILPMFHVSPIKRNAASETLRPFLRPYCTERGLRGKWQICKCEACLLSVGHRGGRCAKNSFCSRLDISFPRTFCLAIQGELTLQNYSRYFTEPCPSQVTDVLIHGTPLCEQVARISSTSSTFPLYSSHHVVFSRPLFISGLYSNSTSPCKSRCNPLCPSPCLHENI